MTMTANPFTSGQTLWNEHEMFISKTARSISYSYAKVEEEDVLQEISIYLWENEDKLLANNVSDRYIKTCILNLARNYALKVRDTVLLETDTFYYSFDEVRELLPYFFGLYETWATAPVPDGCSTMTKNDNVEMMCDFSMAFEKLNESMQQILIRKYGEGEELSEAKDRQQASRALKKFVLTLNATTDQRAKNFKGPGNRQSMTNAKGVWLTNDDNR